MNEPEVIRRMLAAQRLAVIGLSDDPSRPSNYVSAYMQQVGMQIFPVNPNLCSVLGVPCYASLRDLPMRPDVVNVFRLPRAIPAIIDEMIAAGLNQIWVQQGIVNMEAARYAEANGIAVVMDRCIMVEHRSRR